MRGATMTTPSTSTRRWIITHSSGSAREVELDFAPLELGRSPQCNIQLEDPLCAPLHATLTPQSDHTWELRTHSPTLTVNVNDVPTHLALITAEDTITIGQTNLNLAAPSSAPAPFTLQGYHDEDGNYIPGYYDDGTWHLGYGYHDEDGEWCVVMGYFTQEGEWVDEPHCSPRERGDIYSNHCFGAARGDTLEVAMLWSDQVLSVVQYPSPRSVMIGSAPDNDFTLEHSALTLPSFPLVLHSERGYFLAITPEMRGRIDHYDQTTDLSEVLQGDGVLTTSTIPGAVLLPLTKRTSARIVLDQITLLVSFTDRAAAITGAGPLDRRPAAYIAASGLVHALFLLTALTMPGAPDAIELDGADLEDRFAALVVLPEQPEELPQSSPESKGGDGEGAPGNRAAGDEGKAGKEDAASTDRRMARRGEDSRNTATGQIEENRRVALDSGALAVLGAPGQVSPFGANEDLGKDAISAIGTIDGVAPGENNGFGGLGFTKAGSGGGGDSIKMDLNGTPCLGGHCKNGNDVGLDKRTRRAPAPDLEKDERIPEPVVIPGKLQTADCMSREQIASVVRRRRNEIRYCYERGLQKNPRLSGQLKVNFKINGSGQVFYASIKSSTLDDKLVEQCVRGKIQRWQFPAPEKCNLVNVNYPFNFRQ